MTLIQAWSDSLSLLKPKNLQLFALVTLKSIVEAYKILLHYWWWLFLIVIGSVAAPYIFVDWIFCQWYADRILTVTFQALVFATLLSTRPSLQPKNYDYFRSNVMSSIGAIVLYVVLWSLLFPVTIVANYYFAVLFFFDSEKKVFVVDDNDCVVSIFHSINMTIYNLPLMVACACLFYLPGYLFDTYVYSTPLAYYNLIGAFLLPVVVCTYTNIYIKKLHDQFSLYFKQPKQEGC